MAVTRDLKKEQLAVGQYQSIYKKKPDINNPQDRAQLYKLAYPSTTGLPEELKGTVDESLYSAGVSAPKANPLSQTVAGSNLPRLGQNVESAQAGLEKVSQPNEALRVLQEAIRAKSGQATQGIGESDIFKQAGVTGMGALSQSIAAQGSKLTSDFANFQNIVSQMSGTYKDMADTALRRYDNAYKAWKDETDRLQKIETDLNDYKQAIDLAKINHDNAKELARLNAKLDPAKAAAAEAAGLEWTPEGYVKKAPVIDLSSMPQDTITGTPNWLRVLMTESAAKYGVPASLISAIIKNESGFDPNASNVSNKEKSYGLGQINLNAHPEITKEQATNPQFAIDFVAKRLKEMTDKYGVYEGIQAYNTPGAVGSEQLKKYADRVLGYVGPINGATKTLTPADEVQIKALAVELFGKLGGAKETNLKTIRDLYSTGKTVNDIRDLIKYSNQSVALGGTIRDAASAASLNMPAERRQNFLDEVDRNLSDNKQQQAINNIKNVAIDAVGVDESKVIRGKERTVQFLNEVQADLDAYEAAGGKTNIFKGTTENLLAKVGEVKDPELRKIATKIATAIQTYRRSMTGVAFSAPENEEYKKMFPTISKVKEFNKAVISGLKETFVGDLEYFYKKQLGEQPYNELIKDDLLGKMDQTSGGSKVVSSGVASTGNKFTIEKE